MGSTSDDTFAAGLALTRVGTITFNPAKVTFNRSVLFDAIREASNPCVVSTSLGDEGGRTWKVKFERDHVPSRLSISSEPERFFAAAHLAVLSESSDERLKIFGAEANRVNLPRVDYERWASVISHRALTNDEVEALADDIGDTPIAVSSIITSTLNNESVSIDTLVPRAVRYYERLVGRVQKQPSIKEYTADVLVEHMRQLLEWSSEEGLRQCLLLCSHSLSVGVLAGEPISTETFVHTLNWAATGGDPIARCAAMELGLLRGELHAEVKKGLAVVSNSIAADCGEEDEHFKMLSSAFVCVYGQFACTKLLASKPSYWRRLAAFAQAALITRCMAPKRGHLSEFAEFIRKARARPFALQGYVDPRLSPLWHSEWVKPNQLRNELIGRVLMRAASSLEITRGLDLEGRLLGDGSDTLKSKVNLFMSQMPGPLEDNIWEAREMLPEEVAIVVAGLEEPRPTARSFVALVNSAFCYRYPFALAEMAAGALQRSQFRIDAQGDRAAFIACLIGLSSIAAITRCNALAEAVFTVLRYYRRFSPVDLELAEAIHVGIIACASHSEMSEWAEALGNLMSEFAFGEMSRDEALGLHRYILDFCNLVPELWSSLGPALAASEAAAAS